MRGGHTWSAVHNGFPPTTTVYLEVFTQENRFMIRETREKTDRNTSANFVNEQATITRLINQIIHINNFKN